MECLRKSFGWSEENSELGKKLDKQIVQEFPMFWSMNHTKRLFCPEARG
jgi:hypothetical protein